MERLNLHQGESVYYVIQNAVHTIYRKIDEYASSFRLSSFLDDEGIRREPKFDDQKRETMASVLANMIDPINQILYPESRFDVPPDPRNLFVTSRAIQRTRYEALNAIFVTDESYREAILTLVCLKNHGTFALAREKYNEDKEKKAKLTDNTMTTMLSGGACGVISIILIVMSFMTKTTTRTPMEFSLITASFLCCLFTVACGYHAYHITKKEDSFAFYRNPQSMIDLAEWFTLSYNNLPTSDRLEYEDEYDKVTEDIYTVYPELRPRRHKVGDGPEAKKPKSDKNTVEIDKNLMKNASESEYTYTYCDCGMIRGDTYKGWYCPSCKSEIKIHPRSDGKKPILLTVADKEYYKTKGNFSEMPLYPFWCFKDDTNSIPAETLGQFIHCKCGSVYGHENQGKMCPSCNTTCVATPTYVSEALYEAGSLRMDDDKFFQLGQTQEAEGRIERVEPRFRYDFQTMTITKARVCN